MAIFRVILISYLIVLLVYVSVVGANHGWDMAPILFGDIMAVNWSGQVTLEFAAYFFLSIIWVLWRNKFSAKGFLLSLAVFATSVMFLLAYLVYLSFQCRGNVKQILVGDR